MGLLHAAAAGAVVLGGLTLALPGVVEPEGAVDAAAHAVAFGLGCLRVPLEAGGVHGTFAPLSGLLLTLWGLASAARRVTPRWPAPRSVHVAALGVAFALACSGAAVVAGAAGALDPSIPGAALAGLSWGALAAAWATRPRGGPAWLRPALVTAGVTAGLAATWFLAVLVVRAAQLPGRELAGVIVLGLAAVPNAVAGLVAIALGASVEVALTGDALRHPLAESLSLWDWAGRGTAPVYALALVVAPLVGTVGGGRLAAIASPSQPAGVRGLRNGAVFGAILVAAGWAGSLSAAAAGERVAVRFGFPAPTAFVLALAWGVGGAYAASLPWPRRGSRVRPP